MGKSAKYTILLDDHRFTKEQLEWLCYFSCHSYNTCDKVLSIPKPIEYADKGAKRGKERLEIERKKIKNRDLSTANSSGMTPEKRIELMRDFNKIVSPVKRMRNMCFE